MKKSLLILAGLVFPLMGIAEEVALEHQWVKNVYGLRLSPNGKYIGSMAGNASVYTIADGVDTRYETSFLGNGNCIADNGVAVGSNEPDATVMVNGVEIFPEAFKSYSYSQIDGINRPGTRICGIVNNRANSPIKYVPYVADIDASGVVTNLVKLPFPERDFFNMAPAYVTALCISDDGKTIGGQVTDWRGMYVYPIVYQENNGQWSYTLPSEELFNPEGEEILENPWIDEPVFPEPENFIADPVARQAYLEAYEAYSVGGGPEPDPEDYMTPEEYQKYTAAVEKYNVWYNGKKSYIREYAIWYARMLTTSPSFTLNETALSPTGAIYAQRGGVNNQNGDHLTEIYTFNLENGEIKQYETPDNDYFPQQVLADGTILITKGLKEVPTAYILLPGNYEFMTIQEYFDSIGHGEVAEWLDELCPGGTGVVNMSADKSVMTGALYAAQMADFDFEFSDYYYSTYIVYLGEAGVESIIDQSPDGIYKVYNLQGVKVLETKDGAELNSLGKGVYVINGKKVILAK